MSFPPLVYVIMNQEGISAVTKIGDAVTSFPYRENHTHDKHEGKNSFKLKLTLKVLEDIPYIMILKQPQSGWHTTENIVFFKNKTYQPYR